MNAFKTCNRCGVTKQLSDFGLDSRKKDGHVGICKACRAEKLRADYAANPARKERNREYSSRPEVRERYNASQRARRAEMGDEYRSKKREEARRYRESNRERYLERAKRYRESNPEARKASLSAWKSKNKHVLIALVAKRRAAKLLATPAWADDEKIKAIYAEARSLSVTTGVEHHADHIVPLLSPIVCGLHCEANLIPMPAGPNKSKGNRYWPDMP